MNAPLVNVPGSKKRRRRGRELQKTHERVMRRRMLFESLEDRSLMATFNVTANVADGAAGSLREAINTANANSEDDVINLAAGTYTLTQFLGLTESGKSVSLIGAGALSTIIDVNHTGRVFNVGSGVTAAFEDLKIINGGPTSGSAPQGAGIYGSSATISITNSILSGNRGVQGGGIYVNGGTLTVANSTIETICRPAAARASMRNMLPFP